MSSSSIKGRKEKSLLRWMKSILLGRKKKSKLSSIIVPGCLSDDDEGFLYDDVLYNAIGHEEEDEYESINIVEPKKQKPRPKKCKWCRHIHSPVDLCHGMLCRACYSKEHIEVCCPYMKSLPRDAKFNSEMYEISCEECACPFFNADKWICPSKYCRGVVEAQLVLKKCSICSSHYHNKYECPEDEELAARYKSAMEEYYLDSPE